MRFSSLGNQQARIRCRVAPAAIERHAPGSRFLTVEKDAFYLQLNAVQKKLPKVDIVVVMDGPNAEVGSENTFLEHVMEKHGLSDRSDNGVRFVYFYSFHRLLIGGTMLELD